MLPNNKLFVVWVLDGLGLCEDVIRWEILGWLIDWEKVFVKRFGLNWKAGNLGDCFKWCCREGHLEVVKWLWYIFSNEKSSFRNIISRRSISTHNESDFVWCCSNGQLDVAKWMWEVAKESINIHVNKHHVFLWCCESGQLDVVKWLWEVNKENINIHYNSEIAFIMSCGNGYLNVAKWLWDVCSESKLNEKIDIHIKNEQSFIMSYEGGHMDVTKWLWKVSNGSIDMDVVNKRIDNISSHKPIINYLTNNGWLT